MQHRPLTLPVPDWGPPTWSNPNGEEIEKSVGEVVQFSHRAWEGVERRGRSRIPFSRLILLTPLRSDNYAPARPPIHVVGKHLAPRGIDFFYHQPIEEKHTLVSLPNQCGQWIHLVTRIRWCRFLQSGWYDAGGQFTQLVRWPQFDQDNEQETSFFVGQGSSSEMLS